mgnify:CR=1 FL=1
MARNPERIDALDENNRLRGVLTRDEARQVIESGRGVAVGRTCMKYVRLRPGVTLGQWMGGSHTTRRHVDANGIAYLPIGPAWRDHKPVL